MTLNTVLDQWMETKPRRSSLFYCAHLAIDVSLHSYVCHLGFSYDVIPGNITTFRIKTLTMFHYNNVTLQLFQCCRVALE